MNLSPLRYPGSKNKFYNHIIDFLKYNNITLKNYAEPYAGGASVALKLLFNNQTDKIFINDLDKGIYSFWYSILNNTDEFIKKIKSTPITIEEWQNQRKNLLSKDTLNLGFATFYLNRTNYSGIIKAGAIGGLSQSGKYKIDCRFNKEMLIKKIETIAKLKNNIIIFNLDANEFIRNLDKKKDVFFYIDPPYFKKGKELYMNFYNENDHIKLSNTVSKLKNNWLLSYDNCSFIKDLYTNFVCEYKTLFYSAGNKKFGSELFIHN